MKTSFYVYVPRYNYMENKPDYVWIILADENNVWGYEDRGFIWTCGSKFPRGIPDEAWIAAFHNAADRVNGGPVEKWEA